MSEAGGVCINQLSSRVSALETDVTALKGEQSKQDTLLETVAEGVFELRQDFEKRFDAMDQRLTKLEGRVTNIENTMVTKFEFTQLLRWLDDKFAEIDRRFAEHDAQFAAIKSELSQIKGDVSEIKTILQKMNRA